MPRKTIDFGFGCPLPEAGFNEAAARCRGKPRHVAASTPASVVRFNEAAARCRGKPEEQGDLSHRDFSFNEAAARCRGKPPPERRGTTAAKKLQ